MKIRCRIIPGLASLAFLLHLNLLISTAFAQTTMFTYQGRVTANGAGFTGTGLFEFALVTSSNANQTATATANPPSGGFITGYTVTAPGNGYVSAPAVTVSGGGGSGAAAHANISGGAVISLSVDSPGSNYTSGPMVTIAPPPPNILYTTYWSNDGSSVNGSQPGLAVSVPVTNGLFTVVLGDTTQPNMAFMPASLFAQPGLQLLIWFNDGTHGFAQMLPAQNLTPTPYAVQALDANNALTALTANNVSGSVSAAQLTSIGNTNGGTRNFFAGPAGNATMSGDFNTAAGMDALINDTSGEGNTAFGSQALKSNNSGIQNTAIGAFALDVNGSGSYNTAVGNIALLDNSGSNNTAVGQSALQHNEFGNGNTAVGQNALGNNAFGSGNIAIGQNAGTSITTGSNNIYIGNPGFGDETNVIRIGTTQTKAVFNGIHGNSLLGLGGGVVCVDGSGLLATGAEYPVALAATLKLGTNAQFYASGGIEDLYIIRGVVSSTGAILAGTGFTVSHTGTGLYTITFTTAFSAMPAVTVTPQSGLGRIATCTSVGAGSTGIDTRDTSGTATDNQFNFIAIGPK